MTSSKQLKPFSVKTKVNYSPSYPSARVSSLNALSLSLGRSIEELYEVLVNAPNFYHLKEEKTKPDGSVRRIYSVAIKLKSIQKLLNERFLQRVRYPQYICGSVKGGDYVHNASIHAGKKTVIKLDISNFFPSVALPLIEDVWGEFFGFSLEVSKVLAGLCLYDQGLPQGAPTSPYIANLIFWNREPLIVKQLEAAGYKYSRYVDDIVISCEKKLSKSEKEAIIQKVKWMVSSKGLKIKNRKTKVMDSNVPQDVHGLNVNSGRATFPKAKRKNLRAAVHSFGGSEEGLCEQAKKYRSLRGKLHSMRRLHKEQAGKLLVDLEAKKPE